MNDQQLLSLSYEQKAAILESNGWQTLWSKDSWIKTEWLNGPSKINNIDWATESTDSALNRVMEEHNES